MVDTRLAEVMRRCLLGGDRDAANVVPFAAAA